jgi:hypothetical protein
MVLDFLYSSLFFILELNRQEKTAENPMGIGFPINVAACGMPPIY